MLNYSNITEIIESQPTILSHSSQQILGEGFLAILDSGDILAFCAARTWAIFLSKDCIEEEMYNFLLSIRECGWKKGYVGHPAVDWRIINADMIFPESEKFRPKGEEAAVDFSHRHSAHIGMVQSKEDIERFATAFQDMVDTEQRPMSRISLTEMLNNGDALPIFEDKAARVKFRTAGSLTPQKYVFRWFGDVSKDNSVSAFTLHARGGIIRALQMCGAEITTANQYVHTSLDDLRESSKRGGLVPPILFKGDGFYGIAAAEISSTDSVDLPDGSGRALWAEPSFVSWVSSDVACHTLINHWELWAPGSVAIRNDFQLCPLDILAEARSLGLDAQIHHANLSTTRQHSVLIALSALRWSGWDEDSIRDYLRSNIHNARLAKVLSTMENIEAELEKLWHEPNVRDWERRRFMSMIEAARDLFSEILADSTTDVTVATGDFDGLASTVSDALHYLDNETIPAASSYGLLMS